MSEQVPNEATYFQGLAEIVGRARNPVPRIIWSLTVH